MSAVHYGTPNGPACGARFTHDGLTAFGDTDPVTCSRCKRTVAYRTDLDGGPPGYMHEPTRPRTVALPTRPSRCCAHSTCTRRTTHPGGLCDGHRKPLMRINLLDAEHRAQAPVYRAATYFTFVTPMLHNGTWVECEVRTSTGGGKGPVYYRLNKVRPVVRYKEN